MNKFTLRLLCLAIAGVTATGSASAATFCVGTGVSLASALTDAAANNENDVINIRQGVFSRTVANKARWTYAPTSTDLDNDLYVSGGWSVNDNCATRTSDPSLTVLDGEHANAVLEISPYPASSTLTGRIDVENLTLANGSGDGSTNASCLGWYANGSSGINLFVDNVIVRDAIDTWTSPVAIRQLGAGSVILRNMVIAGNTTTGTGVPGGLWLQTSENAYSLVGNNSIHDNHGTDLGSGVRVEGVSRWYNNVVADNTSIVPGSTQIHSTNGVGVRLWNNHFQTRNFVPGVFEDLQSTAGDPLWTLQGIFRIPLANSPLRDSGTNSPLTDLPLKDILNHDRIVGGTVDRGAVEYSSLTLFANGFEG